jgi:hypothetical protein
MPSLLKRLALEACGHSVFIQFFLGDAAKVFTESTGARSHVEPCWSDAPISQWRPINVFLEQIDGKAISPRFDSLFCSRFFMRF